MCSPKNRVSLGLGPHLSSKIRMSAPLKKTGVLWNALDVNAFPDSLIFSRFWAPWLESWKGKWPASVLLSLWLGLSKEKGHSVSYAT